MDGTWPAESENQAWYLPRERIAPGLAAAINLDAPVRVAESVCER